MTENGFIHAAQLNSAHSNLDRFSPAEVTDRICRAAEAARLDILIVGGEEHPPLYWVSTDPKQRVTPQVFLWYAVLADNPVLRPDYRIVDYRCKPSAGWRSAAPDEVGETFTFACPNHPDGNAAILSDLERQLAEYPFDGVFVDKIRFPSPANGLADVFSCFCPSCQAAAADEGLDLGEVKALLDRISLGTQNHGSGNISTAQAGWLEKLTSGLSLHDQEILAQALRFRAGSITRLVEEIHALTQRLNRRLALDLFSPGLAYLVGQDYPALAGLATWVKPMIYRYALGPAGLRLEIPELVQGFQHFLNIAPGEAEKWMQTHVAGLAGIGVEEIEQCGAPAALIIAELSRAVELAGNTPVYMGVEAVSIPAFNIRITPDHVREMASIAREAGARGIVLSWDLLSMPQENLLAVKSQ